MFDEFKKYYEDLSETNVGAYLINWVKGAILLTCVLVSIYILACFIKWTIILPPHPIEISKDTWVYTRVVFIIYSLAILPVTFGGDDDY